MPFEASGLPGSAYGILPFVYPTVGIVAATTCLLFYRLVVYPRYTSPLRVVPGPPPGGAFLGHFPEIIKAPVGEKYGPAVRAVGPFGIERLILMKPDALYKILVSDWVDYPRPTFMRNILGVVAGYGLLTVTGNEHKMMRKSMNPAFSIPNLMAQTDMYYDAIEGLIDILGREIDAGDRHENGSVISMYNWMSKVTLDIICETAFGYRSDSLHNPHNELAVAYEHLIDLQTGPNLARFILIMSIPGAPRLLSSGWAYRHRHWFEMISTLAPTSIMMDSMHRIKRISSEILQEKLADSIRVSDTDAKRDIMSLLVRARKADLAHEKGAYAMSDQAMMDQVLTFLGAGHETTASGLAWTLWFLANDQTSQDRLRDEVIPIFESNPRPDYRTLKDLEWLDCVIMESLRLMPPVPMTFRKAAKTDYIDGVLVPKGTLFYIPIRVVNTWTEIWGPDAEEFNPSRWKNLPPTYHPAFSLLSFISGPHGCIGKTMAIIEMKAVIAALVAKFVFSPGYEGQVAQPTAAVTMKPKDNMPLRVRKV
ncbi:cytochrome P450 [Infundibulicybe gibba]|nr:cytochrome P450 [Infundibulicybe gibba]